MHAFKLTMKEDKVLSVFEVARHSLSVQYHTCVIRCTYVLIGLYTHMHILQFTLVYITTLP